MAPCVLNLYGHLGRCSARCYYIEGVVDALKAAIQKTFEGILIKCGLSRTDKTPYKEAIYIHVALLDPNFGFHMA